MGQLIFHGGAKWLGALRSSESRLDASAPGGSGRRKECRRGKLRPSKPKRVTVASMKEAVASAGAAFPLITVYRERIKRGVCHVGKLVRVSQRTMTIGSITPQAEWEGEDSYCLRDITLLEFGGTYETLLKALAMKVTAAPKPDQARIRR